MGCLGPRGFRCKNNPEQVAALRLKSYVHLSDSLSCGSLCCRSYYNRGPRIKAHFFGNSALCQLSHIGSLFERGRGAIDSGSENAKSDSFRVFVSTSPVGSTMTLNFTR